MRLFSSHTPFITITAFYALSLAEYHMNMHTHDSCEIMYVTKGCCRILVENQEYILQEQEFIFLDSLVPHCLIISDHASCSLLNLEFQFTGKPTSIKITDAAKESPSLLSFLHSFQEYSIGYDSYSLGYSVKDLIIHLEKNICPSQDQIFMIRLLFFRFLLELTACLTNPRKGAGMIYLKKACSYISSHLTEEIRISPLAEFVGINKSYLQALFSKYMNSTITEYINKKRLEQAIFLLINSSLTITDIAFHCGYNSRQHFAKTFQKHYDCSPKTYRSLHGQSVSASTGSDYYYKTPHDTWNTCPFPTAPSKHTHQTPT